MSVISRIYDPLGLVGPLITEAKEIMQQLWLLKLNWDESVPINIHSKWTNFQNSLLILNDLRIPRCLISENTSIDLHGFCDASEKAYGACIYAVSNISNLLCSKARVAPTKSVSIPRLELCGALCLAQLLDKVRKSLTIQIRNIYLWSDSTIVIAWLSTHPSKLKTFVANRTSEIQELTKDIVWNHVPGIENPADIISRGIPAQEFINNPLWWHGPSWLLEPNNQWPNNSTLSTNSDPQYESEFKPRTTLLTVKKPEQNEFLTNYSSFEKLKRIVAYCTRFKNNCSTKIKINRIYSHLTVKEIEAAKIKILNLLQQQSFPTELMALQNNHQIKFSSPLLRLDPFIDDVGLIRVGGRLTETDINYEQRHPIILPKDHHLTKIIIKELHQEHLHCGPQALLGYTRLCYWPISGRRLCRKIVRECVTCVRYKPAAVSYKMGNLPPYRTTAGLRPFINTGVDYCGPFAVKESKCRGRPRTSKGYIAIFICLATKAVHIEFVTELSTEAFIAALRRFTSRRGLCSNIYSDNGTNFVGANNTLTELYNFLKQKSNHINHHLLKQKNQWHFIPPKAPHFGGIWEAAVISAKIHLTRVIKNEILTYEEYNTLIIQIEACLNSRPITQLSNDINDAYPLTPGHFLIGDSLIAPVEHDTTDIPMNKLTRWNHIQQLRQHFWQRWSRDYLHQLQEKHKWQQGANNLSIGTLVVLIEDNLPPQKWSLGRINQLHPGEDGVVRVVSVKTNHGLFKRAVKGLCVLPV